MWVKKIKLFFLIIIFQTNINSAYSESHNSIITLSDSTQGTSISLFTMVNNQNGRGGHSSLLIHASERVIFDPAGRVRLEIFREKMDVLYGINDEVEKFYLSIHARVSHHVVKQTIFVSPATAERALNLAIKNGPVAPALCARAVSTLLQKVPGFEGITITYFPEKLMAEFALIDGVKSENLFEYDDKDKSKAIRELEQQLKN